MWGRGQGRRGGCKDAIERVNDAELAVEYTRQASRACMISYGNLEDQAKRLESARAYLSEELQTAGESNERQEREKLVEKGRRRFSEMNGLMGKIGKALLEAPKSMATARERIRAANLVMKENTCVGRDGSLSSDSGEVKRVVSTREWRGLVLEAVKDELREAERKEAQRI
ncbi:hypothetical protein LSM04_002352 [Trypanosoma melophagium]|uniref:uncharacterized protein n=1 Tax=Trypanosoma melophagium TaxID=715481 RepID=UPI00351AB00B|nr:hypothetical protein LSM04_002352 [Trypanosoma melophagium]